ncbi:MAG: hypothetical protein RLZZ511_484 [Cyanobacteriota bacterium]|jgi:urease accessory protein
MILFTDRIAADASLPVIATLPLTADERTRSRYRYDLPNGLTIYLQLPRGTVLQDGDVLRSATGECLRISAKPEPVLTVTARTALELMLATYHLGNRHVPLEVTANYLRLAPDSVLQQMLVEQLKVNVTVEIAPFCPQSGAYQSGAYQSSNDTSGSHGHSHGHYHSHHEHHSHSHGSHSHHSHSHASHSHSHSHHHSHA